MFICDECVELCNDIIREKSKSALVKTRDGVPTPLEICKVLIDYVTQGPRGSERQRTPCEGRDPAFVRVRRGDDRVKLVASSDGDTW